MSDLAKGGDAANGSLQDSLSEYVGAWWGRVRNGDLGSLPIIIGIIVIALGFGTLEPLFFSARNFVNLLLQMSGLTAIAIGVVFILLIAEIDLSVAYVSGVGGVAMTLLLRESVTAWPWWAAVATALLMTTIIGLLHGLIITKTGVPSFVVTLAGLLAWSGVVLIMTTTWSTAGTIVIQNQIILNVANSYLTHVQGWLLFGVVMVAYAGGQLVRQRSLRQQSLNSKPTPILIIQIVMLALITGGAVWYANTDRGVPTAAVIILVLLVFWSFIASSTRFGRYVYAVGGNPEAARRAGIDVDRIRIAVFMIASFMADVGGIILASRLRSVDTNTGGGNLLLNAIAAAVIGGTSLFGGSGRVSSALLGALVIQSVENGMGLMGWASGQKFVVNGLVLLAAVLVDAFSRRSRASSGLA
jgi:D-xylose transport system permease protein